MTEQTCATSTTRSLDLEIATAVILAILFIAVVGLRPAAFARSLGRVPLERYGIKDAAEA